MWRTLIRDVISPLVGLGILVHQELISREPRYLLVLAALALLGLKFDGTVVRALSGRFGGSSPPTPSPPPSPEPDSASG